MHLRHQRRGGSRCHPYSQRGQERDPHLHLHAGASVGLRGPEMSRHPRRRPQDDIKEMVLELLRGLLAATQLTSPAVCEAGNVCTRDRSAVAVSDEDLSCFTCEILTCEGLRRGDILGDGLRMTLSGDARPKSLARSAPGTARGRVCGAWPRSDRPLPAAQPSLC